MKQVLQDLKNGETYLIESPSPQSKKNHLLIESSVSLISVGTERMLVDFGKGSLLAKVRQQPEKVKQVLEKVKTDGLLTTLDAVKSKLNEPLPLGYCNVGRIKEVGEGIQGFSIGERVVSNGPHASTVRVAKNLCAKIPETVSDREASFTVLASIGLQGIRLARPTLGESFAVIGAGLIGLLTVQLLRAQGCRVLAIDFDQKKLELAKLFGAETCNLSSGENPVTCGLAFSRNKGVDGVLITASTKSDEPVSNAALMSRKRGRIVLVGVAGLSLNRSEFYEKELSFQVSCSYGPGRYDSNYEEKGEDYPLGFVRWTEQRNFEAVLDLMAAGALNLEPLISHQFAFNEADQAYDVLSSEANALGILLEYEKENIPFTKTLELQTKENSSSKVSLSVIGAGNYASRVLIPAFKKTKAELITLACSQGVKGAFFGKQFGFKQTSTSLEEVFAGDKSNTVVIASQHDTHASFVLQALEAGKHVFVEKPLAIQEKDLQSIKDFYHSQENAPSLMIGFNRRFSPLTQIMKKQLARVEAPKSFVVTVNAGFIPLEHWTQDLKVGGGRIVGEACHFIDLLRYLTGAKIASLELQQLQGSQDTVSLCLTFHDGSIGTIHYFANGAKSFPKERIEVFASGKVLQLDNFCKLSGFSWPGFKGKRLLRQDKGQQHCVKAFVESIEKGLASPIPLEEIFEVSEFAIEAQNKVNG
jgi:predicted dehydrogenase/threonine dehydrogenase-like Zn-dependent dehydrogenase